MKSVTIQIDSIKNSDAWTSLAFELKYEQFKKEHPELDEEEDLPDLFYKNVIEKYFQYGEYANIELVIDENFNIIGGKIIELKGA